MKRIVLFALFVGLVVTSCADERERNVVEETPDQLGEAIAYDNEVITDTLHAVTNDSIEHKWELTGKRVVLEDVMFKMTEAHLSYAADSLDTAFIRQTYETENGMSDVKYLGSELDNIEL